MLLLTVLSLALGGTLGCIATLIFAKARKREASHVPITDIPEELTRTYWQASWRALAEDTINSSETYVRLSRPNTIAASLPSQSYRRALTALE